MLHFLLSAVALLWISVHFLTPSISICLPLQVVHVIKGPGAHRKRCHASAVVPAGPGLPQVGGGGRQEVAVPATGTRYIERNHTSVTAVVGLLNKEIDATCNRLKTERYQEPQKSRMQCNAHALNLRTGEDESLDQEAEIGETANDIAHTGSNDVCTVSTEPWSLFLSLAFPHSSRGGASRLAGRVLGHLLWAI